MEEVRIHEEGDLPPALEWQALGAVRVIWPDPFAGALRHPTRLRQEHEPDHDLVAHAVLAAGETLLAYASIVETTVAAAGASWRTLGLSNVFTFPSLRGEGAGRRILAAADAWIDARAGADLALLFSAPAAQGLYARAGWQMATGPTLVGPAEAPAPHPGPGVPMMRPISPRARAAREALLAAPVHVGARRW